MSSPLLPALPLPRVVALVQILAFAALAAWSPETARSEMTVDDLRDTEAQIQELSTRVMPCTVSLIPGGEARRFGTGSGVVVSRDGLILTAAHVAVEMNEKVTVIFPDGSRASAKVLGMDFSRDAAMLQITDQGKYPFVELGDSDAMETNTWCIAIGHAGGYQADRTPPVRLGRVVDNDPKKFLTSDSALIGGDSGGPLFDIEGKLIGIHSNIGFSLAENRHVPIAVFVKNWDRLKKGERFGGNHVGGMLENPERPVIGAILEDASNDSGALIRNVIPGSPAERAGLEAGDRVVQVEGTTIADVAALMTEVGERKAGDTLRLIVRNGKQERGIAVKLVSAGDLRHDLNGAGIPDAVPQASDKDGDGAKPGAKPDSKSKPGEAGDDPPSRAGTREDGDAAPEKDAAKDDPPAAEAGADADEASQPKSKPKQKGKRGRRSNQDDGAEESTSAAKDGKAMQAEFDKRMRESIDDGELELSPEEFEKFGGAEGFRDLLRKFQEGLTPADIAKLMKAFDQQGRIAPEKFDPDQPIQVSEGFFREVLDAFHSSVAEASDSTHLVFRGSEWKTLCTVVREDGYAVTKASEIETNNNQALNVLLEKGRLVSAKVVHSWPEHDLALLKLDLDREDATLTPVRWYRTGDPLALGTMVAAAGSGPDPLAIGVVSVLPRSLSGGNKGFLGISTESHPQGVRVSRVLPTGNAGKAGIEEGDVITMINDAVCDTPEKLIREVSGTQPGATVTVHFLRDGKEQSKGIQLGDRGDLDGAMAADERANRMNRFGTDISRKSSGYLRVLQSDLPIEPEHCGGPVVDLEGRVIGLNISRAGRIKTYALLAEDVALLVEQGLQTMDSQKAVPLTDDGKEKGDGEKKVPPMPVVGSGKAVPLADDGKEKGDGEKKVPPMPTVGSGKAVPLADDGKEKGDGEKKVPPMPATDRVPRSGK